MVINSWKRNKIKILIDLKKEFGSNFPGTIDTCNNLAKIYDLFGEPEKAQEYRDRVNNNKP